MMLALVALASISASVSVWSEALKRSEYAKDLKLLSRNLDKLSLDNKRNSSEEPQDSYRKTIETDKNAYTIVLLTPKIFLS